MWIIRLALKRPYTFVVAALLLLPTTPFVLMRTALIEAPRLRFHYLGLAPNCVDSERPD